MTDLPRRLRLFLNVSNQWPLNEAQKAINQAKGLAHSGAQAKNRTNTITTPRCTKAAVHPTTIKLDIWKIDFVFITEHYNKKIALYLH